MEAAEYGAEEEAAAFTLHAPLETKQRHDATASRLAPKKKNAISYLYFNSLFSFLVALLYFERLTQRRRRRLREFRPELAPNGWLTAAVLYAD